MSNFGMEKAPGLSQKQDEVVTLSEDNFEADVDKIIKGLDMTGVVIEGDETNWVEKSNIVTEGAEKKLLADEDIRVWMSDLDYVNIISNVITSQTSDKRQLQIFTEGIEATTNKEAYVEQATEKLFNAMKDEVMTKINEQVSKQKGNA